MGTTNLLYSFPTTANDYAYTGGIFQFEAVNSTQIGLIVKALHNFDDVCNISLSFTNVFGAGNIRYAKATQLNYYTPNPNDSRWHFPGFGNSPGSAEASPPDPEHFPNYAQGDVWFNHEFYNGPQVGSFFYAAGLLHETGHALGLKHGHQTGDAHGVTFPTLPVQYDSQEYTVMTYTAYVGGGPNSGLRTAEYPSTLMMLDIAALQYLYGADYTTRASNTVYKWNPATGECSINGVGQGATYHSKILMTVWDGGGRDTFDFSNYKTPVVANLQPGTWSTPSKAQLADLDGSSAVHLAHGSIATALLYFGNPASLIENAYGGSSNDRLYGNTANNLLRGNNGNDTLKGGLGRDLLYGGKGNDQFVYGAITDSTVKTAGQDIIYDFVHGDRINLKSIDANIKKSGNQTFTFHNNFTHHTGEVQFDKLSSKSVRVTMDVDGDGHADAAIIVKGVDHLVKTDFIL